MKHIRNLGAVIQDTLREEFIAESFAAFGKKKRLLDLGCGVKPFLSVYGKYCETSIGIDVAHSPHGTNKVDVIYDGKIIPFPDAEFDYVLCTEVMEHDPEPKDFLKEIQRVLKPGGILIMTVPFMVPLHEDPYDFYRYTKYGLKHLIETTGYSEHHIRPFSEYFGVIISLGIAIHLKFWNFIAKKLHLPVVCSIWNPFIFIFIWFPQQLMLFLYRRKSLKKIFSKLSYTPKGYGLTAIK
jgi:SAM-dependent methyltransferase